MESSEPTICDWCRHGHHVVMVVSESLHVPPSNTPSAVNACRVARSTRKVAALVYSSSSSRPAPQLLWEVLIVLSTCSSTTFDSSATVCTPSCASSRCLQLVKSFLSPHANFTCQSLRVARTLYLVADQIWLNSSIKNVLRHVRPLLLTSTRSGRGSSR